MSRTLSLIQNLSLDVTLGAVITSLFVAKSLGVTLSLSMMVALAIAIWLIYTLDHLLDGRSALKEPTNPRHSFHKTHFKTLLTTAILVFGVGLVNLMWLPQRTILAGSFLVIAVGLYLGLTHFVKRLVPWDKEIAASLIYSLGIFVAPLSLAEHLVWQQLLLLLAIYLIVLANLLLFPLFEYHVDRQDEQVSIATKRGKKSLTKAIWLLLTLNIVVVAVLCWLSVAIDLFDLLVPIVLLLMNLSLCILMAYRSLFMVNARYRLLGDGIFLLPLIALI